MNKKGISLRYIVVAVVIIAVIVGVVIWQLFIPQPKKIGEPIRIGEVANLTGAYAAEGTRIQILFTYLIDQINAEGGVYLKGDGAYHPIELVIYDGESQAAKFSELVGKMASERSVHFIHATAPSPFIVAATSIAEQVGAVPFLGNGVLNPIADLAKTLPQGLKWTWHYQIWSEQTIEAVLGMIGYFRDKTNGVVGMMFLDDTTGRSGHKSLSELVPKHPELRLTLFDPGLVPPGTTDLTPMIIKLKEANVEIVRCSMSPTEFFPFRRQMEALGWKPKILCATMRDLALANCPALGDLALGIMADCWWWYKYPFKGNAELKELWEKISGGLDLIPAVGIAYASFHVGLEAIKIAGTLDREAINEAFKKVDIEMPTGRIKFDPETHFCTPTSTIGQYVKTEDGKWDINIIWAPEGSGITPAPAIFPLP